MINVHHLYLFHQVAAARGFTRAAEQLYISQPALSRQVHELEQELGVPLIDRVGRRICLTEAGETLFEYTTRLFGLIDEIETVMRDTRGLQRGRLAIGASTTIGMYVIPATLAQYRATYSGIDMRVEIGNTRQIADAVLRCELELGLVEGPIDHPQLAVEPLATDELLVILPPNHTLAGRTELRPTDLAEQPFVLREPGSGTRLVADTYLRSAGIVPHVVLELGSTEAIKRLIMAGVGLGIISRYAVVHEIESGRLAAARLIGMRMTRGFSRITLRSRRLSLAARAFNTMLDTALRSSAAA